MNQLQTVMNVLAESSHFHPNKAEAIAFVKQMMQAEPAAWIVEFENGEQELHFNDTKESLGESQKPLTSFKLSVIQSATQKALSQRLIDELREVANKPEYDNMYFSTTIGVLEMLKMELYESIKK